MARAAKTAKSKAAAKRPATRKPASRPRSKPRVAQRLKEVLEQQAATAEILRVISSSRTDTQPVFDTIAANALRLCDALFSVVFRFDGELIHIAALHNVTPDGIAAFRGAYPRRQGRGGATQRAILTRSIVQIPDVRADPAYAYHAIARKAGCRSILSVPMLKDGEPIGTITVYHAKARPFPETQIELLKTFADQAVIAVENVRLFTELEARNGALSEALARETATAEILRVISGSPTDIQPVFDVIGARAEQLCDAEISCVATVEGELIHLAALHQVTSAGDEAVRRIFPMRLSAETVTARTIRHGAVVHSPDVLADPSYEVKDAARAGGFRGCLGVPMVREGQVIGAIFVARTQPGFFADTQVALLQIFADQAVIAIENVRLFSELQARNADLTEALERQTATGEVLKVISRSAFDLQPVLDTVVERAVRLCGAEHGHVHRFDGELLRLATGYSVVPEMLDYLREHPAPLGPGSIAGVAGLERRPVHWHDVLTQSGYKRGEAQKMAGFRTMLAVPMLSADALLGVIVIWKRRVDPFTDKQIELVKTFADQAVIAIENVRLFTELQARNADLTEALEQQTATGEVLRVIASSPTDTQPVFDLLAQRAGRLCDAEVAVVSRFDGKQIELAAIHGVVPEAVQIVRSHYPMQVDKQTVTARTIRDAVVVQTSDLLADRSYEIKDFARAANFRAGLGVPIVRDGTVIGSIFVGRSTPGLFTDSQVELLKTFADQAVIAIENVRLFKELEARNAALAEALEQQTATSEILRVISQSQTDVQPVFDAIVAAALKLSSASSANLLTFDGKLIHLAALVNLSAEGAEAMRRLWPRPPSRDMAAGRAILDCSAAAIPDVLEDLEFEPRVTAATRGFRSVLAVPLVREGSPIGAIAVGRPQPGPFPDKQVALLQTFADQAVIAIENVRLFKELEARNTDLTEALEQQTATSDILRVISQSQQDAQPVFETIAAAALKLCRASSATLVTFDGKLIHLAAMVNTSPDYAEALREFFPRPPSRDTGVTRAIQTCSVVVIPDVVEDREYAHEIGARSRAGSFRSVLAVPLVREGSPIGAIAVGRPEPGPFPDAQVELLKTFADQAVIAIENARLFKELEARTAQLTRSVGELQALGEVGQAVSSTLDLETVLRTIVSRATKLAGMDAGSIYEYDHAREEFYLHTSDHLPDELVDALRAKPIRKGEGALGRMAVTGEPVQIRDIADERAYQSRLRQLLIRVGCRSLLVIPLLRENFLLGALAVYRNSTGEFAPHVIELLKTFATQSALAIQNARLFREIEDKSRQLQVASQHKSEFLANMSHELRTPLNAIIGFSEVLAEKMFGEVNDKQAEYLVDILDSGRHLLSLINDILDLSKIEAGRMELNLDEFNLPTAIDNTLMLMKERAHRRDITLVRTVDERLGTIHADERKVKQVLLNLLSNALKFTPEGGRIDVRARVFDSSAEISVTDTGVGIAPEDQATVFEEFRQVGAASKKVEGTGLGLAISRKFIELHGGRIWVESQVGKGSTFAFTVPLMTDPGHHIG